MHSDFTLASPIAFNHEKDLIQLYKDKGILGEKAIDSQEYIKKIEDDYEFSFWVRIKKDDKYILGQQIKKTQSSPHINNSWEEAYNIIKVYLSEKNLIYSDMV